MTTEALYKELHLAIEGFVRKRVDDPNEVEDLVQDIFLKAHTKLPDLKDGSKIAPWLYRIARNTIIDHYRKRKPHDSLVIDLDETADETGDNEIYTCLNTLVSSLPDDYRIPLAMSDIDGVKQHAIAKKLGISYSGARSRVQRARKMVKERFDACCVEYICGEGHTAVGEGSCKACAC